MAVSANDPLAQQYAATVSRTSAAGVTTPLGSVPINTTQAPRQPAAAPTAPAAPGSQVPAPPSATSTPSTGWDMPGITDPSWFAVSRGYQLQADTAGTNAAQQEANLRAQAGLTRGDIQYQGETQRRNAGGDAEGRGILRSGEYERNLAEQMRQEQSRLNQVDMSTSTGVSGIEQGLASQMAGLRSSFAEQGQQAAQQQYINEGTQQAQMAAAGLGSGAASAGGGTAIDQSTRKPMNGGLFMDDKGNYFTTSNGVISNIGWDMVNALGGSSAAQQLGAQNSNDFRKAAGVTW